jgi:hypothetical protein
MALADKLRALQAHRMKTPEKLFSIERIRRDADRMGQAGTYIANLSVYGSRRTPKVNAGTAIDDFPASGMLNTPSVYQGPHQIRGGAPVFLRNKLVP